MRPDVEEYEDVEDSRPVGSSRAMSWAVLAVAVGGFAALAYYAYQSGTKPTAEGVAVIEADPSPIKSAPENPDGEEFANKDKTIYDVISGNDGKNVEKLMPEPERPITATNVEDSEDSAPVATPPRETVAAVAKPPTTFVAPKQAEKVARAEVNTPPKPYEAPVMINEKKPTVVKETPKPEAKKPAAKSSSGGGYKLQLGAYQSEDEAEAAWKKISKKYSAVLSDDPDIIKAELPKGTFYRLRTGSYESYSDAKAACAKLAGQACMVVK